VGINGYGGNNQLNGCVTDVDLQRELLIHRFGFHPQDILTVTDESEIKPTRNNILQAFEQHLIQQAEPDDVVVFHFSGHGSQVIDPNSSFSDRLTSTLVPKDREVILGTAPHSNTAEINLISDLTGGTLFLLMAAIKTENLTAVLDTCHSGGGTRGNLKIRAIPSSSSRESYISPKELDYQEKWRSKLQMTTEQFRQQRKTVPKGVLLTAAKREQWATDRAFSGFYAGAFTYAMTQYLWQETGDRALIHGFWDFARLTTAMATQWQIPTYQVPPDRNNEHQPIYFLNKQFPPADAVILDQSEDRVKVWLGGVSASTFAAFNRGAVFSVFDQKGEERGWVQLESREGLSAIGKLIAKDKQDIINPSKFLQEKTRVIPKGFRLTIGIDPSLNLAQVQGKAEDLFSHQRFDFVLLSQQGVSYILGKMTKEHQEAIVKARDGSSRLQATNEMAIPALNSIGLFDSGFDRIPDSFGKEDETLEEALARLRSKFLSLLATQLIKLVLNANSSRLKVLAQLKVKQKGSEVFTSLNRISTTRELPVISVGSQVHFQVTNQESNDLYLTVLVIDPNGRISIIFPNHWSGETETTMIKAGETRIIPEPEADTWQLIVGEPLGRVEVLVIASLTPINEGLKAVQSLAREQGQSRGPIALGDDATETVDRILTDLDRGSRHQTASSSLTYDYNLNAINTTQIAPISMTFNVSQCFYH